MIQETDLLRKAREGDPAAAEELYVNYLKNSKSISGLLRRGLSNPDDREEMLHEIYLQLISGTNTFRGESKLSTYVYQVARITVFQKFRRENTLKRGKIFRTVSEPMEIADGIKSNPEYTYAVREARDILTSSIERLPDAYREVLKLRVLQDLSYEEISDRMKLPLNTVSTKIHKGKAILSKILKDRGLKEVSDI
jgi:RNA polymerase sigma-70 factor (ECF subfamily)